MIVNSNTILAFVGGFSCAVMAHSDILVYLFKLDIDVAGTQGRLELELYPTMPNDLASHFASMCGGRLGRSYSYSRFFYIVPGGQCSDF